MDISRRVRGLKPSSTVAVMNKAAALKRAGVAVLNFSAGEPDFDTPEPAKAAGVAAINANQTKYLPAAGDPATRELIAARLSAVNKIPNVTPDHVAITCGVKMALYLTYQALFDPPASGLDADRQEMLLPVPAWVSFAPMAELAGARIVPLETTAAGSFKLTPAQLRAAITPRTRAVMLNSPSNPCGTMYSPQELADIASVIHDAARSLAPDITVISDELYQHIAFGSIPFASIGADPRIAERTISINGPGKAFAMTGWRVGWLSGSGAFGKDVVAGVTKLISQTTTSVPGFCMAAVRSALTDCEADLARMRAAFKSRADLIYQLMSQLPGVHAARPIGAFYIFPDIAAHLGKTTAGGRRVATPADFAAALLEEHQMAVVPGEDFGGVGRSSIRLSFACSEDQIREGLARLGKMIHGLK